MIVWSELLPKAGAHVLPGTLRAVLALLVCLVPPSKPVLAAGESTSSQERAIPSGAHPATLSRDTVVVPIGSPTSGIGSLVETLVIGAGQTSPEYLFALVTAVALGRNGSLYVLDVGRTIDGARILRFDRAGRYERSIGRAGPGPGEYRFYPGGVRELPDGRILVSHARGVNVYRPSGEFETQWPVRAAYANLGSRILYDPAGFVRVATTARAGPRAGPGATRDTIDRRPPGVRLRLDGSVVDTSEGPDAWLPSPTKVGTINLPFAPRALYDWSPLGYWITSPTATYTLDLHLGRDPRGLAQVRRLHRDVSPVPLQPAERSDWRRSVELYLRQETPAWAWDGPPIPSVKPAIRDFFVGEDGRLWIRTSQPGVLDRAVEITANPRGRGQPMGNNDRLRWSEPSIYDVIEPDGSFVGRVRLPDALGARTVRGDTLVGVIRDDDGVHTVRRYLIRWNAERLER